MARESGIAADIRYRKLKLLQEHYGSFNLFLDDAMQFMGFQTTWMQHDIGNYLQYGPQYLMVQAQRGEAKTTITACFAVWDLIHDPKARVLIVSAGGKTASEIATLVQKLILTMPQLECLRPDPSEGDRTSVEAFDVHYTLKGVDKSPSVASIGIFGNIPGKRADLLIADDIESPKNSLTAANREQLLLFSSEFSSVCSTGRIVYLGTPQTSESIYNTLPGRGYDVRIWPGRFPTPREMLDYGPYLAPSIVKKLEADPSLAFGGGVLGDMGQVTDPVLLNEEMHQKKYLDKGPSSYKLNFMLSTRLSDAMRFPLKIEQLVVLQADPLSPKFPLTITRGFGQQAQKQFTSSGKGFTMALPHEVSQELAPLEGKHMRIDPAGGGANGDETAYAITGFLNSNIYLLAAGGIPGGYDVEKLTQLAEIAVKHNPNVISIEKNMGYGAFAAVWLPILRKAGYKGAITEDWAAAQKEQRIIKTLEPVIGRGSLIVLESVIEEDDISTEKYQGSRISYSLFHQLQKITRDKGALKHDDRVDALEGAVAPWLQRLAVDQEEAEKKAKDKQWAEWFKDPLGRNRAQPTAPTARSGSVLTKYLR